MKPTELSLLVVHRDKGTRQLLATYLCETYQCVTAAAPEELDQLLAQKSFDLMIGPQVAAGSSEEKEGASPRPLPALATVIRSSATANRYELRLINRDAASCMPNPFETSVTSGAD